MTETRTLCDDAFDRAQREGSCQSMDTTGASHPPARHDP